MALLSAPVYLSAVGELNQLLLEVRALRAQLERSVQENSALRIQLQKQLEQQLSSAGLEARPSSLMPASPLRDTLYRRQLLHGETALSHVVLYSEAGKTMMLEIIHNAFACAW